MRVTRTYPCFPKTCKFLFNLATLRFMNFHPCCSLQDFLYVSKTLRKVTKGISQLQDSPRSGVILIERKRIILIPSSVFSLPLHSLSSLQSESSSPLFICFPDTKRESKGYISVPDALEFLPSLPRSAPAKPCLQTNSSNSTEAFRNDETLRDIFTIVLNYFSQ